MPRRRIVSQRDSTNSGVGTLVPAQEDEADILEEVGAEPDENGNLVADEEKIRETGAVDAASVIENRRIRSVAHKKRVGEKVRFNSNDLLTSYDAVLLSGWAPNTFDIFVIRLTGSSQPTQMITTRPRSGAELYEALRVLHGVHEEAGYSVDVKDGATKQFRICGAKITMPDTRPAAQQGQPMTYPQNGAPSQQAPAAQPQATDPMSMMRQMFDMFRQMQSEVQPQPAPQMQFPSSTMPAMPPMPSPQAGPAEMMAWMQQMWGMFQQMQGTARPATQTAPAPSPPPSADPMAMMTQMFELFMKMQNGMQRQAPEPRYPQGGAPPYARSAFQGQQGAPPQPPPPPQREKTPAELFRESISVVRQAADAVQEMRSLFPGEEQGPAVAEQDDSSPVTFVETGVGKVKLAYGRSDGAFRWAETGMTLVPDLLKWVGEQREAIQKERAAQREPPRQQLAPGYVEVHPGYKPPPGYVAVPVEQEQDLPPPPDHVPPPIQDPPRQAWGAPTIPSDEPEQ